MNPDDEERARAVRRLWAKRGFKIHLTAFVIVSLAMLLIWATAGSGGDYFWPIWPIAGWGTGLAVHAWITFGRWSLSEAAIQREIRTAQERAQQGSRLDPNEGG